MRILPVVLFLAHGALLAEGRTGQLSISLSRGEGLGPSGSIVHDLEKRQNDAFTGGKYGYTTFLRGNSDQLLRNAAANAAAPDLSYQSMQTRFAFEYGSSDLVGIGFSIVDQKLNVRGIRSNVSSEPATLLLLSTLYPSSSSAAYNQALIDMELLDPLVRTNALPYVHATSLNALLRIHPMDGILDPYGGLSVGLAREWQSPTYAWRLEPALGIRIHAGRIFAEAELTYTMLFPGRKGAWPLPPKKQWNEGFLQLGVGAQLD
jgi:hypothetical protein